jgi:SAM-dependent methyltransferase
MRIDVYDGINMPYPADTYDVVILADVLHHEPQPERLFGECVRVAKQLVIVKDHQRTGLFAQQRISLLDWAVNFPEGVPCTFRYNTPAQWAAFHRRHGLDLIEERCSMDLYPSGVNLIFGGGLQYLAVLDTSKTSVPASHGQRRRKTASSEPSLYDRPVHLVELSKLRPPSESRFSFHPE